jgi:hypothetical protein
VLKNTRAKELDMRKRMFVAAACAAALAVGATAAPAAAASRSFGEVTTLASDLLGPWSVAADRDGTVYVSQNVAGTLERFSRDGERTTVATVPGPGQSIAAVSTRRGEVYYAQGSQAAGEFLLMRLGADGTSTELADLGQYEADVNPDAEVEYGFTELTPECAAQFPPPSTEPPGPETTPPGFYTGIVDTNPFASAATSSEVYVADAAGNDILRVGLDGEISTVAVLPPSAPITATEALLEGTGYPDCALGQPYVSEPVPTDIEIGPDGWLYVTLLPGGPEDPALGARGSVVKINPDTQEIVTVATGLAGATGLAVAPETGAIVVTELTGGADNSGQVAVILPFSTTPVAYIPVTSPAAIEYQDGKVYITYNAAVFGEQGPQPGSLAVLDLSALGKHWKHHFDD